MKDGCLILMSSISSTSACVYDANVAAGKEIGMQNPPKIQTKHHFVFGLYSLLCGFGYTATPIQHADIYSSYL